MHREFIKQKKNEIARTSSVLRKSELKEKEIEIEKEVDDLATKILMPESVVKQFLVVKGFNHGQILNQEEIKIIVDYFKVSPIVAVLRLKKLQYVVPYLEFS